MDTDTVFVPSQTPEIRSDSSNNPFIDLVNDFEKSLKVNLYC